MIQKLTTNFKEKSHLFFQNQHLNQGIGDQSTGELEVTGDRAQTACDHLPQ